MLKPKVYEQPKHYPYLICAGFNGELDFLRIENGFIHGSLKGPDEGKSNVPYCKLNQGAEEYIDSVINGF